MAESNARIMDMVRREIQKNPSVPSQELFEKAKKIDRSIGDLNVRQFHARYPLQVKRTAASTRKSRAGGRAAKKGGAARKGGAAKKTRALKRAAGTRGAAKTGARRGRPPGTKTGARRGRPPGSKTGARRGRPASAAGAGAQGGAAPAKRRGRPPRAAVTGGNGGAGPNRDRIRSLLLQFARDIAGAEGKADVVDVIGEVDRWVEQVVSAAR